MTFDFLQTFHDDFINFPENWGNYKNSNYVILNRSAEGDYQLEARVNDLKNGCVDDNNSEDEEEVTIEKTTDKKSKKEKKSESYWEKFFFLE